MRRATDEPLNHGALEYGTIETLRNEKREKAGEEFISLGLLYFNYFSIRQDDFEMYDTPESRIELKLKTYYIPEVNKSHKVKIDDDLYAINGIDVDKDRKYMFWYLAKAGGS